MNLEDIINAYLYIHIMHLHCVVMVNEYIFALMIEQLTDSEEINYDRHNKY